jgi:hypothetical protein
VDDAGLDISTPVLWNQDAAFGPTSWECFQLVIGQAYSLAGADDLV